MVALSPRARITLPVPVVVVLAVVGLAVCALAFRGAIAMIPTSGAHDVLTPISIAHTEQLLGTWHRSGGTSLTFYGDGTCTANIALGGGASGTWSVSPDGRLKLRLTKGWTATVDGPYRITQEGQYQQLYIDADDGHPFILAR